MSTQLPNLPPVPQPQIPQSPIPPEQVSRQAQGFFSKSKQFLRRIWNRIPKPTSLGAKISLLTAVFLVTLVAVVWAAFTIDPIHVPWQHWMSWPRIAVIAGLVIAIPLVVYRAVRLWTEGDAAPYSDIDYAWKAGLQALADNGLSIDSIPVLLVLGSTQPQREKAIVASAAAGFRVRETPEGPAPLHWYANPDGIYIFCGDVGCSSSVAARIEKHNGEAAGDASAAGDVESAALPHGEHVRQVERLRYVCQLLRRSRRPFCPINGVVSLLPFSALRDAPQNVEALTRSIRADLTAVMGEFQLRCPVTALFVDLEREQGFREVIRRRADDHWNSRIFGQPFDVRCPSGAAEMTAFCSHLVGVFEDCVYSLFREADALSHPGNTHLYELLSHIRYEFRERLTTLLVQGFGCDRQLRPGDPPVAFSGCFFAATGDGPGRQAFIEGVFARLLDEQESVEWSDHAVRANRRQRVLSYAAVCVGGLAVVGLIAMVMARFSW
ncbi:MAG: type VI secretion protein IcmF/TssM N-terminal domain-containing protein [Pirellulaceae bacterium]